MVRGLPIAVASLLAEHGLWGVRASAVVARGFSSCGSWALEHKLSSCGSQAWLLHGMCNRPGLGIKPVPPALAGRFFTTGSPEKSKATVLAPVGASLTLNL